MPDYYPAEDSPHRCDECGAMPGQCDCSANPSDVCPNCGGTEHAPPLPGTVGRRCVKCCDLDTHADVKADLAAAGISTDRAFARVKDAIAHPGVCNNEYGYEAFCGKPKGHAGRCHWKADMTG